MRGHGPGKPARTLRYEHFETQVRSDAATVVSNDRDQADISMQRISDS